jgi:hypothetical protein
VAGNYTEPWEIIVSVLSTHCGEVMDVLAEGVKEG